MLEVGAHTLATTQHLLVYRVLHDFVALALSLQIAQNIEFFHPDLHVEVGVFPLIFTSVIIFPFAFAARTDLNSKHRPPAVTASPCSTE